jgi:hypothetical protein
MGKLIFLVIGILMAATSESKTLEFDWRFDISVTEKNEDRDPKSWKTFCYNGCPLSSSYIPDKGLDYKYGNLTWSCRIESKEDVLQTLRTPTLTTFEEMRSVECVDSKSNTIIREVLVCKKDAKTGRKLQPDMLGYNFETINLEQKINGKWYELRISIECK